MRHFSQFLLLYTFIRR